MQTEVVIVGGGLAGSTLAAMLGRAEIKTCLVDPHPLYPADFRCEKLDSSQIDILAKTGLTGPVTTASTPVDEIWVARYGRLLDKKPNSQCGFFYEDIVNAIRAAIPDDGCFLVGKVKNIETSCDRQQVTLANGKTISSRLVVLANGLNLGLVRSIGMDRQVLGPTHSVSIGFNLRAAEGRFAFPALTYFAERAADRAAYLTLFPIGNVMRANLFVYRQMDDPWLKRMRRQPAEALAELMPGLQNLTGAYEIGDDVKVRPVDLCVVEGHRQPGVVLVGDAFSTSCPAAGTGAGRALTDVELLANRCIPQWLSTPGMEVAKISEFYDDVAKLAYDAACREKAFGLKSLSIEPGPLWLARRLARFGAHFGFGKLRALRQSRLAATSGHGTVRGEAP